MTGEVEPRGTTKPSVITAEQIKAARQLLGWSTTRLAARVDRHPNTVSKAEQPGQSGVSPHTLAVIRRVLEKAGVEFAPVDNGEVSARLRKT